jgi:hypothetical protein
MLGIGGIGIRVVFMSWVSCMSVFGKLTALKYSGHVTPQGKNFPATGQTKIL